MAEYRTQGTVCLSIGEKDVNSTFTITPTSDYQVTHQKRNFLVFVAADNKEGAVLIELRKEGAKPEFKISFGDKDQPLLAQLAGNCNKAEFVVEVDGEPSCRTYTLKDITFPVT